MSGEQAYLTLDQTNHGTDFNLVLVGWATAAVSLLLRFGCACWVLWLPGRTHERVSKRKPTTTKSQPHRQNVIKRGWDVLQPARKRRHMPALPPRPAPRVLE